MKKSLAHRNRSFQTGKTVTVGEDVEPRIAENWVRAGAAELVGEGGDSKAAETAEALPAEGPAAAARLAAAVEAEPEAAETPAKKPRSRKSK